MSPLRPETVNRRGDIILTPAIPLHECQFLGTPVKGFGVAKVGFWPFQLTSLADLKTLSHYRALCDAKFCSEQLGVSALQMRESVVPFDVISMLVFAYFRNATAYTHKQIFNQIAPKDFVPSKDMPCWVLSE